MWYATRAIPVLDIGVVFGAPDIVEGVEVWERVAKRMQGRRGSLVALLGMLSSRYACRVFAGMEVMRSAGLRALVALPVLMIRGPWRWSGAGPSRYLAGGELR